MTLGIITAQGRQIGVSRARDDVVTRRILADLPRSDHKFVARNARDESTVLQLVEDGQHAGVSQSRGHAGPLRPAVAAEGSATAAGSTSANLRGDGATTSSASHASSSFKANGVAHSAGASPGRSGQGAGVGDSRAAVRSSLAVDPADESLLYNDYYLNLLELEQLDSLEPGPELSDFQGPDAAGEEDWLAADSWHMEDPQEEDEDEYDWYAYSAYEGMDISAAEVDLPPYDPLPLTTVGESQSMTLARRWADEAAAAARSAAASAAKAVAAVDQVVSAAQRAEAAAAGTGTAPGDAEPASDKGGGGQLLRGGGVAAADQAAWAWEAEKATFEIEGWAAQASDSALAAESAARIFEETLLPSRYGLEDESYVSQIEPADTEVEAGLREVLQAAQGSAEAAAAEAMQAAQAAVTARGIVDALACAQQPPWSEDLDLVEPGGAGLGDAAATESEEVADSLHGGARLQVSGAIASGAPAVAEA
ncbi:hypothetical protein HYH03_010600 [Edaphochlamys debaryana]|uniref:Uncharacterized protein n=1 Tax=Edaphochlamys debaryana TaxID=47281 RepID=A0A835XWJ5_9CHLO|nr:hypothetical protein HYH03_010600 [Edaphochlamys debaryana]|eukprot:KAG2491160.1 hypothetical protein HYH03_010600 [Edaphochlamys debaryana]